MLFRDILEPIAETQQKMKKKKNEQLFRRSEDRFLYDLIDSVQSVRGRDFLF